MELDQLQHLWAEYNQNLEKSLRINETLLRKMNLDKARRQLRFPLLSDGLNIGLTAIFVGYMAWLSFLLMDELRFSIPGFLAAMSAALVAIIPFMRMQKLWQMDFYRHSVLDLQKQLFDFQLSFAKWGRVELFAGIPATVLMWPIILYTGFEVDIYQDPSMMWMMLGICAVVAVPILSWHGRMFRNRIGNLDLLLEEIRELEDENP